MAPMPVRLAGRDHEPAGANPGRARRSVVRALRLGPRAGSTDALSKCAEKRDQSCFLFACQLHVEPLIMVVNHRRKRGRTAIVQVRGAASDAAQPRHFKTIHMCPLLREERLTRVAGFQRRAGGPFSEGVERKVGGAMGFVTDADVHQLAFRVGSYVGRIVASATGACDFGAPELVVES